MSVDSGLFVRFALRTNPGKWQVEVLRQLHAAGWEFEDQGQVSCLPSGDDDDFEWGPLGTDFEDVWELFNTKLMSGETLGVVITWQDSKTGGNVLVSMEGTLTFSASINRKCVAQTSITDVSWYLERLLGPLESADVAVASWRWEESDE